MNTQRFINRLISRSGRWLILIITVCALCACGTTDIRPTQATTAELPMAVATAHSTQPATPTATVSTGVTAWNTYRSDRAGYSIDYPATWKVDERVDSEGTDMTTFSPAANNSGTSIAVIVRNNIPAEQAIPDLPNTRCQQVTINGLSGRRCFDTLASSISTTFSGQGKQYTIVASGKHLDQNIYQRFLESFTVTA